MNDLQNQIDEAQTAYSINQMIRNVSLNYEIFKFLIGEKSKYCDFTRFLYFYHSVDGNLAKVICNYLHLNSPGNVSAAVEAAKQLFSAQEVLQKHDFNDVRIEYIAGNKSLFAKFEKNFHFSAKKMLESPGKNSKDAYYIAVPSLKLFIKPTPDLKKAMNEVNAYLIAEEMGIGEYFLANCAVKIYKNSKEEPQTAIIQEILPFDAISLDELEDRRPGSNDGVINRLVEKNIAHKLAVFDYLISNPDRHKNNFYISGNKITMIDHSEAFEKKESGFIPGYLRLSDYKLTKRLPVSKNEQDLKEWLNKINLSNTELNQKLNILKESEKPSEKINELWEHYYVS